MMKIKKARSFFRLAVPIAVLTEHWEIAEREFKLHGDHPPIRIFKDRATYDKMRKESCGACREVMALTPRK